MTHPDFWLALFGIVWIDLLLSGDNAVVIALVCRELPARQRFMGIALGAAAAILLRVVLSFFVAFLLDVQGLRLIGGLFLIYVAIGLLKSEEENPKAKIATSLTRAILLIALADISMSVDNVIAIAALSKGNLELMAFGVLLSIPLVITGATIISKVIERFPVLVWAGAGLLGWVAGGIIATDPLAIRLGLELEHGLTYYALSACAAVIVLCAGLIFLQNRESNIAGTP